MSKSNNKMRFHIGKYYEITDNVLGRGSFSTVYLARHKLFGAQVALKVIDRNNIEEEYVSRNLHREAKILKKLNHPNIVNFYEDFSHNELYCLALEHINGIDLSRYLKKQTCRRVSEKSAKILFFQMVSAVHHMHESNILHRDLKQENILLEYGRVIKIVDFGLSNIYQPQTQLRTHCGSLVYAAPELFEHRSLYGAGVDLWSLGVILYSMVVGNMPFQISKDVESSVSQSNKERFLQRISKGLIKENWESMGNLSYDCSNLLENLLQPNQFKRLNIKGARQHPWFQDEKLRNKLPKHRMDLKRRFEPKIINIIANRLHQSKDRIRIHLTCRDRYDRVSAMFFILQDTLVKEVLYPPRYVENTECQRNSQDRKHPNVTEEESEVPRATHEGGKIPSSEKQISQGFDISDKVLFPLEFSRESVEKYAANRTRNRTTESNNVSNIRRRIGDGKHNVPGGISAMKITSKVKSLVPITERRSSKVVSTVSGEVGPPALLATHPNSRQPFRSYKSSRPKRDVALLPIQKSTARSPKSSSDSENYQEENDIIENTADYSIDSVDLNQAEEVNSLSEQLYSKCNITSQATDPRLCSSGDNTVGRRHSSAKPALKQTFPRASISGKGVLDANEYAMNQIAQFDRRYNLRPNTTEITMKLSHPNATENKKAYQRCAVNPETSSRNGKQSQQFRQKSFIIRSSNNATNRLNIKMSINKLNNKMPMNRQQYESQVVQMQRPAFSMPMRKPDSADGKLQKTFFNPNSDVKEPTKKAAPIEKKYGRKH